MAALAKHIETILAQDEADVVKESFGDSDKNIARCVLFLTALPVFAAPILIQAYEKKVYWILLSLALYVAVIFYIIQYRLHWLLHLSHTLHSLYHGS